MPAPMTATSALSEVSNAGYDVAGAVAFQQQSGFPTSAIANSALAPRVRRCPLRECQRGVWQPGSVNKLVGSVERKRTHHARAATMGFAFARNPPYELRIHPRLLCDLVLQPRIHLERVAF